MELLTNNPRPTGYNKQGLLCCALTNTQIRLLRKERRSLLGSVTKAVTKPMFLVSHVVGKPLSAVTKKIGSGISHLGSSTDASCGGRGTKELV